MAWCIRSYTTDQLTDLHTPHTPPTAIAHATQGLWRAATQSICDLILSLLRRLPFVPSDVGKKHWGAGGGGEEGVEEGGGRVVS